MFIPFTGLVIIKDSFIDLNVVGYKQVLIIENKNKIIIENTIFNNSIGISGGHINLNNTIENILIKNSSFLNGFSHTKVGAMRISKTIELIIENTLIFNNAAQYRNRGNAFF